MLAVDVRRGYLRPGIDLLLTTGLVAGAVLVNLAPLAHATTIGLVAEAVAVAVLSGLALLAIHRRRGLPSLPADPAHATLREVAAEEELGASPQRT